MPDLRQRTDPSNDVWRKARHDSVVFGIFKTKDKIMKNSGRVAMLSAGLLFFSAALAIADTSGYFKPVPSESGSGGYIHRKPNSKISAWWEALKEKVHQWDLSNS